MATICFYQDSRHDKPLYWMRNMLKIGYISKRKDGITELRINGFKQIEGILEKLLPFIRFKKKQAETLYKSVKLLVRKRLNKLSKTELKGLVDNIIFIQQDNYKSHLRRTREELIKSLDLTP